jgi:hypothetical protein
MGHQVGALGNMKQSQTISQPCRFKKTAPAMGSTPHEDVSKLSGQSIVLCSLALRHSGKTLRYLIGWLVVQ